LVVLTDAFNSVNQARIRAALDRNPMPHIVPWRTVRCRWRADVLRAGSGRYLPRLGELRGPNSQGCKSRRASPRRHPPKLSL
jgi:hypothetical protein